MKIALSLPDEIFDEAELVAKQLGLSLSELYVNALCEYLRKYNKEQMLTQLNELYSEKDSTLDPVLAEMQLAALPYEE